MTQITQEARRQLIEARLKVAETSRDRRTFKWRDQDVSWPEVQIPVGHALLNPHSHRIKPQIESMAARQRVIVDDPFGPQAQDIIAQLIRETPGYQHIEAEIRRDGQREPGVMTSEGVLINANTRLVAMRELGHGYITVHVLPQDATEAELTELELSFQMRREAKQEYSFTAQLLFIRDLLNDGWSPERIGLELDRSLDPKKESDRRRAAQQVEADARILNIIESVIAASNDNVTYEFFDDEQQTLKDIDNTYQARQTKNPELAERERQAKLTGMLAGLDYRRVRQIDGTYLDDYVVRTLEEEKALDGHVWSLAVGSGVPDGPDVALAGLDVLDDILDAGDTAPTNEVTLQPIFEMLAATPEDGDVVLPPNEAGEAPRMPKKAFEATIRHALQTAADIKDRDSKGKSLLLSPMRHLENAAKECDKARDALGEIGGNQRFDRDKLHRAVADYKRSHDELMALLGQLAIGATEEAGT